MKQWWRGLQARERRVLLVAGLLLGLLTLHGLVWQPWQEAREALKDEIAQRRDDLAWMQQAATRLPRGATTTSNARANGNLITLMNRMLVKQQLRDRMKQMKPVSEREVRLRFEKARFDFGDIDRQGLSILELRLMPSDEPGRVDATLRIQRGN